MCEKASKVYVECSVCKQVDRQEYFVFDGEEHTCLDCLMDEAFEELAEAGLLYDDTVPSTCQTFLDKLEEAARRQ